MTEQEYQEILSKSFNMTKVSTERKLFHYKTSQFDYTLPQSLDALRLACFKAIQCDELMGRDVKQYDFKSSMSKEDFTIFLNHILK